MKIPAREAMHNWPKKIQTTMTENSHFFSGEEMDRLQTAQQVLYALSDFFYSVNYTFWTSHSTEHLLSSISDYSFPFT